MKNLSNQWRWLALLAMAGWGNGAVAAPEEAPPPEWTIEFSAAESTGVELQRVRGDRRKLRSTEAAFEMEYARWWHTSGPRRLTFAVEWTDESWRGEALSWPLPKRLRSLGVEAAYLQVHSERWTSYFSAGVRSGVTGSGRLGRDGFGVQAVALGRYSTSDQLHWWFGVYGDTLAEGSDRLVPLLGLDWSFAARWRLSLGVPHTELVYALSERLEMGVVGQLRSDTFAVEEESMLRHHQSDDLKLDRLDVRVGWKTEWRVHPRASVALTVGTVVLQEVEFRNEGERERYETSGVGGFYGTLEGSWRF